MPRVTKFDELPAWLQTRIAADWAHMWRLETSLPPIRDPEYRVYRFGDTGWWSVDAGTGGVTIERQTPDGAIESHAYADLPDGPLLTMANEEGRRCRDESNVGALTGVILGFGADPRALQDEVLGRWFEPAGKIALDDVERVRRLATILQYGMLTGKWPK